MEALEVGKGQFGNNLGIAARALAIGGVGKEGILGEGVHHRIGRGIDTLHLIEDDPLIDQRRVAAFQLIVPAFLLEGVFGQKRKQHGVEIDIDEVVEVLEVLAGHRIGGLVRKGHGVEEGVHGALQQLHERFLHRKLGAAAQDRVLENMGDAGGILGWGLEGDPKHLVLVVIDEAEHLRPGLLVPEELRLRIDLGDGLVADELEGRVGH